MSKRLLPVCDKSKIHTPLSGLMRTGLREIAIIATAEDQSRVGWGLVDGSQSRLGFTCIGPPSPDGPAQGYLLAADFLDGEPSAMVPGDNIVLGHGFPVLLESAAGKSPEVLLSAITSPILSAMAGRIGDASAPLGLGRARVCFVSGDLT